jgi:hypothetical protein
MLSRIQKLVNLMVAIGLMSGCGSAKNSNSKREEPKPVEPVREAPALVGAETENTSARRLIGYVGLESHIRSRAVEPDSKFYLNYYLTGFGYSFIDDLVALMGVDEANGQTSGYRNAAPTSVNMLLYDMVLNGFANDLHRLCAESSEVRPQDPKYRAEFVEEILKICPGHVLNRDRDAMRRAYIALNGFLAPESEFEAWFQFFDESYVESNPDTTMKHKIYSAMMNPYLLLVR